MIILDGIRPGLAVGAAEWRRLLTNGRKFFVELEIQAPEADFEALFRQAQHTFADDIHLHFVGATIDSDRT